MLEKMWGKKTVLYTAGGNINQCCHYGNKYGGSSKKLKVELTYDPSIPLLGIDLNESKSAHSEDI
jgi:hypothetical protein